MFKRIRNLFQLPNLRTFGLKPYPLFFGMDRLTIGIDNIRIDVHLSPGFRKATLKLVSLTINRLAALELDPESSDKEHLAKAIEKFKHFYKDISKEAINMANSQNEIQIDPLIFTAIIKMILLHTRQEYGRMLGLIKATIRELDLSNSKEAVLKATHLKNQLGDLLKDRESLMRKTGMVIFSYMMDMNHNQMKDLRSSVLGDSIVLFNDILNNPMIHSDNPFNDVFLIETYDILFGRRIEDQDRYSSILKWIKKMFIHLDHPPHIEKSSPMNRRGKDERFYRKKEREKKQDEYNQELEGWISIESNIDRLINFSETIKEKKQARKGKKGREKIIALNQSIKKQKKTQHFFYKHLKRLKLLHRFTAFYHIISVFPSYCPPLAIQQIQHYLIEKKARKAVRKQLKQLKKIYGTTLDLKPLNHKVHQMEDISRKEHIQYMIRYLKSFCRFHRDYKNYKSLREAMDRINLITEENLLVLSRENYTLYEVLLPHEQLFTQKKIINHVVIKADVRGSTDITRKMNEKNLNPASFFSLNFFNPISEVLSEYKATKVFIEGDAIILSIFEHENIPSDSYAVSRSCGLAMNMIQIIERYNEKSRQYDLPILEIGIGICFLPDPPTFLFDGDHRIMISSAINKADRMSGSSKLFKEQNIRPNTAFNLMVCQPYLNKPLDGTKDALYIRYNINGIELNEIGFEKLKSEINLISVPLSLSKVNPKEHLFYTGKFPTRSGRLQRIILRKSLIPVVSTPSLKIIKRSETAFYEVITDKRLFTSVKAHCEKKGYSNPRERSPLNTTP